jgi:hypothetical protein
VTGRNYVSACDELSFEELMTHSSVGDITDPVLDDVCTKEEARIFAAEYSRSQIQLDDLATTEKTTPEATLSEEDDSEVRRVRTLRDVWTELAMYVQREVCEDRGLMAEIMHEAAATFTHYWRNKNGQIDREDALAVLQRAAKLHGRQGRYRIDLRKEIEAALLDHD